MRCPECQHQLPYNSRKYCDNCGVNILEAMEDDDD